MSVDQDEPGSPTKRKSLIKKLLSLSGLGAIACIVALVAAVCLLALHVRYRAPNYVKPPADLGCIIPVEGVQSLGFISKYHSPRWRRISDEEMRTYKHKGIDIFAPEGTLVLAPQDGTVAKIQTGPNAGKYLWIIDHRGEYGYQFMHLKGYAEGLARGKKVRQGEVIAYVGRTGNAANTYPHLHFGVGKLHQKHSLEQGKTLQNPLPFLQASEVVGVRRTTETLQTKTRYYVHRVFGVEPGMFQGPN